MSDQIRTIQAEDEQEVQYDTSDQEQVQKAKKRTARTRADRLEFVRAAMLHEQGRAWFYDILLKCKVISSPFTDDPYRTAFKCGEQNIGLQIMMDIQDAAPEQYLIMVREARGK